MELKTNINLWEISFKENSIHLSTIFNSGFIDDFCIVKEYFKTTYPNAEEIVIKKINSKRDIEKEAQHFINMFGEHSLEAIKITRNGALWHPSHEDLFEKVEEMLRNGK